MDATINGQTESFKDCSTNSTIDDFNTLEYTRQLIDSYTDVDSMKPKHADYILE